MLPFTFTLTLTAPGLMFKENITVEAPDAEQAWEIASKGCNVKLEAVPDILVDAETVG